MRTKNLAELMEALAQISPAQIGSHVASDVVSRALHTPGTTLPQRFGLPPVVVAVLDSLFGQLAWGDARAIAVALTEAVGRPGKDLRRVVWRLLGQEIETLATHAEHLPRSPFYLRLCREVGHGLNEACRGCPWPGALDTLDQLPSSEPPPHGFADKVLGARLEDAMRNALHSTVGALILADQAVVAALRRRHAVAAHRDDILRIGGKAEERVSRLTVSALASVADAGALAVALTEPNPDRRGELAGAARCVGAGRQGAALLQLVRQA